MPALLLFNFLRPMPTYEYRCDVCGHELAKQQTLSDAP
ncbi:MAG: FmdB family zinc ribbon protein [Aeromonas sp.]